MLKVAHKCYLPTNKLMLDLIRKHEGKFRIAYSITGVAIEQMKLYSPETLQSFIDLAKTGCVEFLSETFYHSLSSLYNEEEFQGQVEAHRRLTENLFGQSPSIFRNTELIYSDTIAKTVQKMGYKAIIAEGADDILQWRSPHFIYSVPGSSLKLLLKSYRLSDDIAFRFSNRGWKEHPLTAPKFARWVHDVSGNGQVVNLFMDYETFGEHQWASTGIFEFMKVLPHEILKHPHWNFVTPSEALEHYSPIAELSFPRIVSWADMERDITAWRGNHMQHRALEYIFELAEEVHRRKNPSTLALWRKLQTSDHFYYMCTKWFSDGDVHAYFNPYKSPYEAFMNYMNVLTDFREHVLGIRQELRPTA
jgi:alpha-amylase